MGCCLSTGNEQHRCSSGGWSPPPTSPPQEETVKEVLLETSILPKSAIENERSNEKLVSNQQIKDEVDPTAVIEIPNCQKPIEDREIIVSEVSDVSEIGSFSQSFNNTIAPERDDDGEVNQRPPQRKTQGYGGSRGRNPVRRNAVPPVEKRGQAVPLRIVRNAKAEKCSWRGAGESSSRRLRSPVRRGEVGARRNPAETEENGGGVESDSVGAANDVISVNPEAESLENPVVSLECFIFL